jgi:NAD(P)-dependent dehydrogenase (short-subunit alcohol dehydrogenase family)
MTALGGKRLVLVGATSGIGLETARAALEQGAQVVVAGRSAERVERAERVLGRGAMAYRLDAMESESVRVFFEHVGAHDHLSIFVPTTPNPRIRARLGAFKDTPAEAFGAVFASKFGGNLNCLRHGAGHVRESIVLVTGQAHRKILPGYAAGAAANGALESLARALALELPPVRINVVAPGIIETPIVKAMPPEMYRSFAAKTAAQAVPRMGQAEEVAGAILWLMTNRYVTGAVLEVDGGYKLT